jgi:hypothetical protein
MLFADSDGQRVLRRSLAPIAAWLCCGTESWNQDIRKWVLEAAPEIHLEYGDAMALPLEYRRSLLTEWVVRNSERERVWVRSSPDALRRLSDTRLAGEISGLLVDRTASVDMRNELVQLVRFGRLDVCLPVLLTIISSADEDDRLKRSSLAAIRDIGTPGNWQQLFEPLRAGMRDALSEHDWSSRNGDATPKDQR